MPRSATLFAGLLLLQIAARSEPTKASSLLDSLAAISLDRIRLQRERGMLETERTRVEGAAATERRGISIAPSARAGMDGRLGAGISGEYSGRDWEFTGESGMDPFNGPFAGLGVGYSVKNSKRSLRESYAELARLQDRKTALETESSLMRDFSFALTKAAEAYFLSREREFLLEEADSVDATLAFLGKIVDQGYLNASASNSLAAHRSEIDLRLETIRVGSREVSQEFARRFRGNPGLIASLQEAFPELMEELQSRLHSAVRLAGGCYNPLHDQLDSMETEILRRRITLLNIQPHNVVLGIDSRIGDGYGEYSIGVGAKVQWTWLGKTAAETRRAKAGNCLDREAVTFFEDGVGVDGSHPREAFKSLENRLSQGMREILLGNRSAVYQMSELYSRKVTIFNQIEEQRKRSVSGLLASLADIAVVQAPGTGTGNP